MIFSPSSITKKILIGLLIAAAGTGLYWLAQKQMVPALFRGDIIGGLADPNLDPLLSGRACFSESSGTLEVDAEAEELFDWRVIPPAEVLSSGVGAPASELISVGSQIRFNSPPANDPNRAPRYTVEVVPNGALAGTGETFVVEIGSPCVTAIQFVTPSGNVMPEEGEIQINAVRATLSTGQTVLYTGDDINQLNLNFVAEPEGVVQFVENRILVPAEHPDVSVFMELRDPIIPPVTFGRTNRVERDPQTGNYLLASDEVDRESVAVYLGLPVAPIPNPLEEGVDYVFIDVPHDADAATVDAIDWIRNEANPEALYISYLHRKAEAVLRSDPLVIGGAQCELLQANIFQGRGQGFRVDAPAARPSTGSQSAPFDFGARAPIASLILSNPVAAGNTFGSTAFEYQFDFVAGLDGRAVLVNHAGTHSEVQVRSERSRQETASNFAYAINTVLGETSPFIAYLNPRDSDQVILHSTEVGEHTNDYQCSVNGASFALNGACFRGGTTGVFADGTAIQVVDPPRPLDPLIAQGETRTVYSRGGIGNLTWRSSDHSIFSVAPLSDTPEEEELLGDEHVTLNAGTLDIGDFDLPDPGAAIASTANCVFTPVGDPPVDTLQTCLVTIAAPVTLNAAPEGYGITITPPQGNPIPGTVQGAAASGVLTGAAVINHSSGGMIQATGQINIPVGGSALGSLRAQVTMQVSIAPFNLPADINNVWTISSITGALSKVQLIPTNRQPGAPGAVVTNFAVLSGLRPGRATLFVSDMRGCTAPLEIQVLGEKLFIDFENPVQGEFIEQGDSIQLRAWTGFARGEIDSERDVTNRAAWESDNTDVVRVSSAGRVTALRPGVANVFARFETGNAEMGALISQGSLRIHVDEFRGLTISLDRETLGRLSPEQRNSAYQSVAVIVHDPAAVGRSLTVEGRNIPVTLPVAVVPYASELDQIAAITRALRTAVDTPPRFITDRVDVTPHPRLPGVLILRPTAADGDGVVDITTTALPEELSLVPAFRGGLDLPTTETYRLTVFAEYDSGRTRLIPSNTVEWAVTPVNRLDDAGLETGLLQRGDAAGASDVVARFTNPDGTVIQSNALSVRVPEGPVIEFVRRIGAGSITRGDRVNLLLSVSDIDSVADIRQITASLVRTNANTYAAINADVNAVWFNAQTFLEEVQEANEAGAPAQGQAPPAQPAGQAAPAPAAGPPPGRAEARRAPAPQFKNYTLPIAIPMDANLVDGRYRLLISIHDAAGHPAHFVLPLLIGPVASGDVNGDGRINMIDVIIAFQIANGRLNPTPEQVQAANIDGRGNVTMIDVILLFTQVNRPA